MPSQRRSKKRLSFLLMANMVLFVSTLAVSSAASLIVLKPKPLIETVSEENYQKIHSAVHAELDQKYSDLLHQAKTAIKQRETALKEIRDEFSAGYVVSKDIEVVDKSRATWLAEPKLMLGVNSLGGGALMVSFADRNTMISVGERIDFQYQDCDCFLLLKSSVFGAAKFRFACTPTDRTKETIIEARLN